MALKKYKRTMITSGIYGLLLLGFLIAVSFAKYGEVKTGYTNFNAASFNAVILGDTSLSDLRQGNAKAFSDDFDGSYGPGMTYDTDPEKNTAGVYTFTVANGISKLVDGVLSDNASDVGIKYTVRLRTSGNLPLSFTLAWDEEVELLNENPETGETSTTIGHRMNYYTAVRREILEAEAEGDVARYEYAFYRTDGEGETLDEASFYVDEGDLNLNTHKLIVEWPVFDDEGNIIQSGNTGDYTNSKSQLDGNSYVYMKEVDSLEILVMVSSVNHSASYTNAEKTLSISGEELRYGTGIIIMDESFGTPEENEEASQTVYSQDYTIDYRSFRRDSTKSDAEIYFPFEISNGIGFIGTQRTDYIYYGMELKIPYNDYREFFRDESGNRVIESSSARWYDVDIYPFDLYVRDDLDFDRDGDTEEYLKLTEKSVEYRLYNELYGTYEVMQGPEDVRIPNYEEENETKLKYQLYAVVSYEWEFLTDFETGEALQYLVNVNTLGTARDRIFSNTYKLVYTGDMGTEEAPRTSSQRAKALSEAGFTNKLELIISSAYADNAPYSAAEERSGFSSIEALRRGESPVLQAESTEDDTDTDDTDADDTGDDENETSGADDNETSGDDVNEASGDGEAETSGAGTGDEQNEGGGN